MFFWFFTSVVLDGDGLNGVHPEVHGDQDDAEEREHGGDGDHHHPPNEHSVSWQSRLLYNIFFCNFFLKKMLKC